jgi:endonuclease/exonuclease/phosphatase family metal-dependent hydrolase
LEANEQLAFLHELTSLRATLHGPWLLCGDFNMIYRAADKSNDRLDRRSMRCFGRFLRTVAVEELHLTGRLFT